MAEYTPSSGPFPSMFPLTVTFHSGTSEWEHSSAEVYEMPMAQPYALNYALLAKEIDTYSNNYPAGFYFWATDVWMLVLTAEQASEAVLDKASIDVYYKNSTAVTVPSNAKVYKSGQEQTGVTSIPADSPFVWAVVAPGSGAGTGSVTSVGVALPNIFTVTGSPVTTSGTITATLASQTAKFVLAAPNAANGVPTFRALVASDIPTLAPLASPTFTGVPAGPTAAANTNTTQLATTAFVIGQAASTTPVANGTAAVGTSLTYARADHVHPTDTTRAPLASPTFTGVPAGPTAAVNTNTTQLATTAFVVGQAATTAPAANGTVAVGTSLTYARADHVHPTDTTRAPLASPTFTGTVTADTITTTASITSAGGVSASGNLSSPSLTTTRTIQGSKQLVALDSTRGTNAKIAGMVWDSGKLSLAYWNDAMGTTSPVLEATGDFTTGATQIDINSPTVNFNGGNAGGIVNVKTTSASAGGPSSALNVQSTGWAAFGIARTTNGTDLKWWDTSVLSNGSYAIRTVNDAGSTAVNAILITRTGTAISGITLAGPTSVTGALNTSVGLTVKEGTNAKQGTATLAAGTVTVANTSVTANSRIFLTGQDDNVKGSLRVSARTAGTSFVITSSDNTDTGVVAYEIFEPGA